MALPLSSAVLEEIAAVAARIDALGWAEAGAGNLSLLLGAESLTRPVHGGEAFELGLGPGLDLELPSQHYLLITAKGRRMRELAADPSPHLRLLGSGRGGPFLLRSAGESAPPSSELPCHLAAHRARGKRGALLHAHTDFLVALSLLPRLAAPGALESALTSHLPEIVAFLPGGVRRLSFSDPGGAALARATGAALATADAVIWDHHGAMAWAPSLGEALDRLEMLEKAARIWWLAHRTGEDPQVLDGRIGR